MAAHLPFKVTVLTREKRLCKLYKELARWWECWQTDKALFRYDVTIIRSKLDEINAIKDPEVFEEEIKKWEDKAYYFKSNLSPKQFANTIGGISYGRVAHTPDWVLDYWHPLEKAQYPKYFATREKRKQEFIKMWEEEYGKPDACKSSHH